MNNPLYRLPSYRGLIGISRWAMTPPPGIYARNWGAAAHDFADGIHHALTGTALSFRNSRDERPLVLLALDLGWWRNREDERAFRHALLEEFELPESHLIVHLSHTHAGPVLDSHLPPELQGEKTQGYMEDLLSLSRQGVSAALNREQTATIQWRSGRCALAANRDLPDPQQPGSYVCGFNPDAPAEDELLVGRVTSEGGECLGVLINYACHPTTLGQQNTLISPDFCGALRQTVQALSKCPCVFLMGASGELAPREQYSADIELADRNGRELAFAALSALTGIGPAGTGLRYKGALDSGARLGLWEREGVEPSQLLEAKSCELTLDLKKDLPSLEEIEREFEAAQESFQVERLRRLKGLRTMFGNGPETTEQAWLWRIGDVWLAAHPFECYSALQQQLRAQLPRGSALAVLNVANGWRGYLVPEELHEKPLYTVEQTPFAPGGLEKLIALYSRNITAATRS